MPARADAVALRQGTAQPPGEIAAATCRTGAAFDVYATTAIGDQLAAREACLRKLVAVLAAEGGHRLVIEQDDSLLERDRSVLYDDVRRAGVADLLTYEHVPARSEPLLWLADTAAWCWTHGPAWRDRIAPAVRTSGSFDSAKPGSPTLRRAAGLTSSRYCEAHCKHATPAGGVKLLALMLTRERGTCLAAGRPGEQCRSIPPSPPRQPDQSYRTRPPAAPRRPTE